MKQLLVVRHAKAETGEGDDHSRALTVEGHQNATELGQVIKDAQIWPQLVLVSTALRAQQTMDDIAKTLVHEKMKVQKAENLYQGRLYDVLKLIESVDNTIDTLMLVGHNPIFAELINYVGEEQIDQFAPCGACLLTFAMEQWTDLESVKAKLTMLELNSGNEHA